MLTLTICLAIAAALRGLALQRRLDRWESVRRSAMRGFTVELRRRAVVCRAEGDSQEYPQPREARVLVLRLAGMPLWTREEVIGLPQHVDGCMHLVQAEDFDSRFTGDFRAMRHCDEDAPTMGSTPHRV